MFFDFDHDESVPPFEAYDFVIRDAFAGSAGAFEVDNLVHQGVEPDVVGVIIADVGKRHAGDAVEFAGGFELGQGEFLRARAVEIFGDALFQSVHFDGEFFDAGVADTGPGDEADDFAVVAIVGFGPVDKNRDDVITIGILEQRVANLGFGEWLKNFHKNPPFCYLSRVNVH